MNAVFDSATDLHCLLLLPAPCTRGSAQQWVQQRLLHALGASVSRQVATHMGMGGFVTPTIECKCSNLSFNGKACASS